MKKPVAQKDEMGCGAACLAFILERTYEQSLKLLDNGRAKARYRGFLCQDLKTAFLKAGKKYEYRHIKTRQRKSIYVDGTIIFIKRSEKYPEGHYLCRYGKKWMDPWINFLECKDVKHAKAGYRTRLPGKPIYAIFPMKSRD